MFNQGDTSMLYFDDQGGGVMKVVGEDVSPTILLNGAKAHALIVVTIKAKDIRCA